MCKVRTIKLYMLVILIIILLTPFLSSCAFKDIDKRIFVQGIAVDYTGNEQKPYKVTLKLAIPTGSLKESQGNKYGYLSREDSSIAEAIRMLKTHTDKEPDFGHVKIALIGRELLDHRVQHVMDFFYRRRDIQMIAWVAIGEPTAEAVLKTEPISEMAASNILTNLFSENGVDSAYTVSAFLFDVRRKFYEPGIDPILPVIQTNKEKKQVTVKESIVLKKEKEPLLLSSKFTKSYNVLAKEVSKYDLRVKHNDNHFIFAVDTINVRYKIDTSKETPVIRMNIQLGGIIEESFEDLSMKDLDTYSKLASKAGEKNAMEFLAMLQEENTDPLGFGLRYRATRLHNRDTLKEWQELYPKVKFDVTVRAKVKSTGTIE